ncbi:hypothetical protein AS9A_1743 [Hoyosella subflava DQS3-9A1]|uniref:Uncharacterized protein n=1 Tax=Hoyosella subflava (strain DSM 45089 / JCM 17490 / NBRC 109087 / DQS3-9A1) TaxID=443218 RepID=F6EKQ6_HOYSD|nr:hypothetical protein AS9A_1743 [Hoyosella subflava DQS3-9A1]
MASTGGYGPAMCSDTHISIQNLGERAEAHRPVFPGPIRLHIRNWC